jgi:hypothetical protein
MDFSEFSQAISGYASCMRLFVSVSFSTGTVVTVAYACMQSAQLALQTGYTQYKNIINRCCCRGGFFRGFCHGFSQMKGTSDKRHKILLPPKFSPFGGRPIQKPRRPSIEYASPKRFPT